MRVKENFFRVDRLRLHARESGFWGTVSASLWHDHRPIREELFSVERLEKHAETLAVAQVVTASPLRVVSLSERLKDNALALAEAYDASALEVEAGRSVVPAAEWLLDNYHLIEAQIREIRVDLPSGYYRQLPKMASGPFAGYPRVFGIAWAYVAHCDSYFDPEVLGRFVSAYQRVQTLTIGELWAVAITLRIVLIENLRRLADQITRGKAERDRADTLVERLLRSGDTRTVLDADAYASAKGPLSAAFAAQLERRLRGQDRRESAALAWLENRLQVQGLNIGQAVQEEQRSRGASNVSVRNIITSIKLISDIDWADWFEAVSLVDRELRETTVFSTMDFATRNLYRSAIETLARHSSSSEMEVVQFVLAATQDAAAGFDKTLTDLRAQDPGYHLVDKGRPDLEQAIAYRAPLRVKIERLVRGLGLQGYIAVLLIATLVPLSVAVWTLSLFDLPSTLLAAFAILAFIPATEIATAVVNRLVSFAVGPKTLPGLDLDQGIPPSLRTLVAVPTLLSDESTILEQVEQLEVHHLASAGGELYFALLSDWQDGDKESSPEDRALLALARQAIEDLNLRYPAGPAGARFSLFHRRRVFNASEGVWMGWERKRGKLHELNRLLRGATDTTFLNGNHIHSLEKSSIPVPQDTCYVIVLDADTRLPRDTAARLIGKMAHPLNQPIFDDKQQRVTAGYAILQPRVTPSLPTGKEGSFYQRVFSSPGGIDPYSAAISEVYQDLFDEGSFTGKGIYHVDMFEAAMAGRVPENTILSHDLFEGICARAGLATDTELVEEFPARYDVASKRQHRWTRGDWQLLPWLFAKGPGGQHVPALGRWKIIDNLRRSLIAPSTLAGLVICLLMPFSASIVAVGFLLAAIALPNFFSGLFSLLPHSAGISLRPHLRMLITDFDKALGHSALSFVFLADNSWRMMDAIVRTVWRLLFSRRHLLEWTTAAQAKDCPRASYRGLLMQMLGGLGLALAVALVALIFQPEPLALGLLLSVVWFFAPTVALTVSRPVAIAGGPKCSTSDREYLRLTARRTWRFFESLVTAEENMLPPDNYQIDPTPQVAARTSPTNMGLYLLSVVAARDFAWIGTSQALALLEATLASMHALPKHHGHFYNWYGTRDMEVLQPAYVSSVDSGNLAAHLIVVANACEEWAIGKNAAALRDGLRDSLLIARETLDELADADCPSGRQIAARLVQLEDLLHGPLLLETLAPAIEEHAACIATAVHGMAYGGEDTAQLQYWIEALCKTVREHCDDEALNPGAVKARAKRLQASADLARAMAISMDFGFLLEPERRLLSIGFSMSDNTLDSSCYDLLASEARLASLFAIAKGDVPTRHWFHLGRTARPLGNASALLSWSGSMFEYLMPSLVLRAPAGSLLEQTNRLIVAQQQSYGDSLGIPWGVSESAYNARDLEMTYQYSNFGVPGLGLKRGLGENLVIAPYATALAAMIDPHAARLNFERLSLLGAEGHYGFFEALDFTPSRLPEGEKCALVRSYMAHHQGMTIVSIANVLHHGAMRERFHCEPMIQAAELLLQERVPRDVLSSQPRTEDVHESILTFANAERSIRRITTNGNAPPTTHLLSNGHYSVMLTAVGSGYSRWRDIAITRWQPDATLENTGYFIFLKDLASGQKWSATMQPLGESAEHEEVIFGEDRAEFHRRDGSLLTTMEVVVSGEDDGEVRQISLTNKGAHSREIELTSYMELVLTDTAADRVHPAFAKLFVQTEFLADFDALIATRRPRSADETPVWVGHFAVVEGESPGKPQYESDRARFLGRANSLRSACALTDEESLSNTVGTVLDPAFSLRHKVSIPAGEVLRVDFWTVVASSREDLVELIDKHHDRTAFDRAKTLAWTQAQVQLFDLNISATEAASYQELAAPILYPDARFRPLAAAIKRGAGPQSNLWPQAISGDLPIVLLRIENLGGIRHARELIRAHDYWRTKRIDVDLVIINERSSSYVQDLQNMIEAAVSSSRLRPREQQNFGKGSVFALRADLLTGNMRDLLHATARVVLVARHGSIVEQLALRAMPAPRELSTPKAKPAGAQSLPPALPKPTDLEFFNGIGGFARDGREYVTVLDPGINTPAPWINVVANAKFGFQISAEGSGYTWAENSRENQLTAWSNDPVIDSGGEVLFVRDEESLHVSTPTAFPVRESSRYIARHGFGYSVFSHTSDEIEQELLQYVPVDDPVKISRLKLTNHSKRSRRLTVTAYAEWVLGTARSSTAEFVQTEIDAVSGSFLARNPWSIAFPGRIAFADMAGTQQTWTADREEFLGRHGSLDDPRALRVDTPLSGQTGAALDPCVALQRSVLIEPGEAVEVVFFLGQCASLYKTRDLIKRYRAIDLDAVLEDVHRYWRSVLGVAQVKTPDRAMDIMLNGWLLYQTLACRIHARSAFYQASGAYGFRDQLQDGMALSLGNPAEVRAHILRAASRQFLEGDVQHWWLPHTGQGVRTRISDDRVWLALTTACYVQSSGDRDILDKSVGFLEGPSLVDDEHDAFFQPMLTDESGTLFEHCARAIDQALSLRGELGLPLIGGGDWNDGMNCVGEAGSGQSVWLGWLLIHTIGRFVDLAPDAEAERARGWQEEALKIKQALEQHAWDGAWYRRASYDDGTWLGSRESEECSIDSIAQSWAVLSEAADPERAAQAMASVYEELVRQDEGLVLLFTPPFDKTSRNPGYIKGYPPGLRENGGQYSHAAMWAIQAFAKLGDADKAMELFTMVNPINHATTAAQIEQYKVEPYVVAADIYAVAPHVGRGGWSWYTGAAGLMYRAGLESILGIRREGQLLRIAPEIPEDWIGFEVVVTLEGTIYSICVDNRSDAASTAMQAELDGDPLISPEPGVCVPLDGKEHRLLLRMPRVWQSDDNVKEVDASRLPCLTEEAAEKIV